MDLEAIEAKYISLKEELEKDKKLSFYQIHGISGKENYHSKFIAFFLNPNRHEFGQIFLNYFIEMLEKQKNNCHIVLENPFSCKRVITDKGKKIDHKKISGGRVDIGILNNNPDKHIVIENKIEAADRPKQLAGYKNMKEYENATFVYLTLTGRAASQYSLGDIKENEYIRISYKENIIAWIDQCIEYFNRNKIDTSKGTANKIYFFLNDYLTVVKSITENARINDIILPMLSEDIHLFFKTHDEAKELKKNNIELTVFQKLCLYKVVPLKEYLIGEVFIKIILVKLTSNNGLKWKSNEGRNIMNKEWGFQFYKPEWESYNVKIGFVFMKKNLEDCRYGLRKYDPKKDYIPECYSNKFKDQKTKFPWYELNKIPGDYTNWWGRYGKEKREGVFFELISDDIENTDFYNTIKNIVCKMCKKIDDEIIKK